VKFAVLTLSITLQGFKSITGRRPQKIQRRCTIHQNSLRPQAATATVATSCYNSSDASYASHPALQARACWWTEHSGRRCISIEVVGFSCEAHHEL